MGPAEAELVGAGEAQRSKRTDPYFFNGLTVSGRSDIIEYMCSYNACDIHVICMCL